MRLAQIQMAVTADKVENLRHAEALLASVKGADMAVLPEMFCCPYDNGCFRAYGEAAGGAAYQMLSRAAAETTRGWWAAPSRSWTAAGCTTPAMSLRRTDGAPPGTGRCTFSTSTWTAASGSRSRTP